MKLIILIGAVVVFIITAILAFATNDTDFDTLIGLTCVGLAAFAASFLPIPDRV